MTRLEILCKLHNKQGGTIHDYNDLYNIDVLSLTNRQWFKMVYSICLKQAHKQYPSQYAWPENELLNVYERMCIAIDKGTYNKDSHAFKQACKMLDIKHTYSGISEYIGTNEVKS